MRSRCFAALICLIQLRRAGSDSSALQLDTCDDGGLVLVQVRGSKRIAHQVLSKVDRSECPSDSHMQIRWMPDPTLCLASDENQIGDGVKMMLRTCDESWSSPGQVFTQNLLNEETEDFDERIRMSAAEDLCIVVGDDNLTDGSQILLKPCNKTDTDQNWVLWSSFGSGCSGMLSVTNTKPHPYCLVVHNNDGFDGAAVELMTCDGDESAKTWTPWVKEG